MHRRLIGIVLVIATSTVASAQSINLLSSTRNEVYREQARADGFEPALQMAVPIGATAGLAEHDSDVGAVLGFQLWKKDVGFLAVFFSFSGAQTISGSQSEFGSFLLNPATNGNSFYLAGNRVWQAGHAPLWMGPSGRIGVTRSTWEATTAAGAQSVGGFVGYFSPTFLLTSGTYSTTTGDRNEYQFGLEVGPSLRLLGGDLAQSDAFLSDPTVLGSADHSYLGYELTFFARLNSAQPFIRISHFSADNPISGFSGTQAIIGFNILTSVFKSEVKQQ